MSQYTNPSTCRSKTDVNSSVATIEERQRSTIGVYSEEMGCIGGTVGKVVIKGEVWQRGDCRG